MKLSKDAKRCLLAAGVMAAEFLFILILKIRAADSEAVVGNGDFRSDLRYYPVLYGLILYLLVYETSTFINASFRKYAGIISSRKVLRFAAGAVNAGICISSLVDFSGFGVYSFSSVILRVLQFAAVMYALIAPFIVKPFKEIPPTAVASPFAKKI